MFAEEGIPCGISNLVYDNEEKAIDQNRPDEDVAKDSSNQGRGVRYHDGPVPVDGDKGPR